MEKEPTPEDLPEWANQLTEAQEMTLRTLCLRFEVEYNPDHYYVWPPDSIMTPGFCEGWLGGYEVQREHPTLFVAVDQDGRAHS